MFATLNAGERPAKSDVDLQDMLTRLIVVVLVLQDDPTGAPMAALFIAGDQIINVIVADHRRSASF